MGQSRSATHIPVVSMLLYAHAAAGPEYEYPAWLARVRRHNKQLSISRSNNSLAAWDRGVVAFKGPALDAPEPAVELGLERGSWDG